MKSMTHLLKKAVKRSIRSAPIPLLAREKLLFFLQLGYWPDFSDPTSFSEKLHARKLRERDGRLVDLSDKLAVRDHVAGIIGSRHLVPLKYRGEFLDTPTLHRLGDNIVVKRNDDSGSAVIIRENTPEAAAAACLQVNARRDYGGSTNEWWYREISPGFLVEERLRDADQEERPVEYKFFVFGRSSGPPWVLIEVIRRTVGGPAECGFFDEKMTPIEWNGQRVSYRGCPQFSGKLPETALVEEMTSIALKLGEGFNFVRVDLYAVAGRVFFSELTFNPAEGRFRIQPVGFDFEMGRRWEQPVLLPGRPTT